LSLLSEPVVSNHSENVKYTPVASVATAEINSGGVVSTYILLYVAEFAAGFITLPYKSSIPFIGAETDGIYSQDNVDCIIENNQIYIYNNYDPSQNDCIQVYRDLNTIVRNNYCVQDTEKIHNSRGIAGRACSGTLEIYNNVVDMKNTQSEAISYENTDDAAGDLEVFNNTIYGRRLYHSLYSDGVSDPKIKNNIFQSDYTTYFVRINDWAGTVTNIDYNIYYGPQTSSLINLDGTVKDWDVWQGDGFDPNGINEDPKFINVDTGQLQLQSNSSAIDNGITLSGFSYDINYESRPQGSAWDMGAYEGVGVDITPPEVVGATIIDSTTLIIEFSEDMVKTEVEKPSVYSFTGGILATGASYNVLTKEVTLFTSEHDYEKYQVTVSNVHDLANNIIDPGNNTAEYEYYYVDTTPPDLNSAELLVSTAVELTFSENITEDTAQRLSNYSIPGVELVAAVHNLNIVTLITTEHSYGNYEVTVNGIEDLYGNVINPAANSATYSRIYVDTTPPELISAVATDATGVYLTFSEWLDTTGSDNKDNYSISGITISSAYTYWQDPKYVSLTTSTHSPGIYEVVLASGITDESGNPISESANSLEYEYTALPELLSVSGLNDITVELKFSKHLEYYTATDDTNYEITGPSSIKVDTATLSGPVVNLTTSKPTANGTYTVVATGVKDIYDVEVVPPNNSGIYEFFADLTPPTVTNAELINTSVLKVSFSESLLVSTSDNIEQYQITKESVSGVVQVYGVQIADDQVYLTTGPHTYLTDYRITVSGVTDYEGNEIEVPDNYALYTYTVSGISGTLTAPTGGEEYYNGQYKPITWILEEL